MRLSEIHIDGFGTWKDLSLGELGEGVTVIYGPNEAGKTTLMQFVRTVLYGFSPARRARYLPPLRGGRPGGSLGVVENGTAYRAVRHAGLDDPNGSLGDVTVVAPDGVNLGQAQLETILAGVDEATFNNVFALGLREIQELGSLDDTAAADHLYRLTGGLDRVSLVDVVRELQGSRQHIMGAPGVMGAPDKPAAIAALTARRDKLRDEQRELGGRTERWLKLATLRSELQQEAAVLESSIADLEERTRVIDVALQARELWTARRDLNERLDKLGEPKRIHKKYVALLKKFQERIAVVDKRIAEIKTERTKVVEAGKGIKINHAVWTQAARIEALTEHSGWVQSLESRIEALRNELRGHETNVQTQSVSAGSPGFDIGAANSQTLMALRRPSKQIAEEEDRFELAKRNAAEAKGEYDALVQKIEQRLVERNETDVQVALTNAAERIQMFRRRLQVEQRLDQLNRHREELEQYRDDMFERQIMPMWMTVGLGALFATGIMLILAAGIWHLAGWWDKDDPVLAVASIGFALTVLAAGGKVGIERQSGLKLDGVRRQFNMVARQLSEVKQQRDQLDELLPRGGGALDVRLARAEDDLKRLEELLPLQTQRDVLKAKYEAAKRYEQEAENGVKEARSRWKAALRSFGLPENFSLGMAKQFSQKGEEITQSRRQLEVVRDELQQRERELLSLATRIDQLMGDIRIKPESDRPQARLEQLAKALEQQRDLNLQRGELRRQLRELHKEYDKNRRLVRRDKRSCETIFEKVGVRNEKEFHRAVERWRRHAGLMKKRDELSGKIVVALADRITEERLDAELLPHDDGPPEIRRENAQARIREHRTRLGQVHERRGQAQQEMAMLGEDRRLDEVKVELGCVERQIQSEVRRWQVNAATEFTLTSVRKIYETHRQPETLREASEYLKQLTEGHYVRIWTPLEERTLKVDDANGKPLRLDVLSRGTREAIFLSLRLALVNSFARRGAKLPLVFDDILVNFDSNRVKSAAAVLRDFAKEHGHQVLMFTCHEHIMKLFKNAKAEVRLLPGHEMMLDAEPEKPKRKKPEPEPIPEPPPAPPPPAVVFIPPPEPEPEAIPEPISPPVMLEPPIEVENVPDFHEFSYRAADDRRTYFDLWSVQFNDIYGVEELVLDKPRPHVPSQPKPVVVAKPAYVAPSPPVAVLERPTRTPRARFAWESPERYHEEDEEVA